MKINNSGLERYQSVVQSLKTSEGAKPKQGAKAAAVNTDKVTISEDAAARAGLSRLGSAVAAEVEAAASPERVAELANAVQNGSYHVASGDIADAILERFGRSV